MPTTDMIQEQLKADVAETLTTIGEKLNVAYRTGTGAPLTSNEAALLWRVLTEHFHMRFPGVNA